MLFKKNYLNVLLTILLLTVLIPIVSAAPKGGENVITEPFPGCNCLVESFKKLFEAFETKIDITREDYNEKSYVALETEYVEKTNPVALENLLELLFQDFVSLIEQQEIEESSVEYLAQAILTLCNEIETDEKCTNKMKENIPMWGLLSKAYKNLKGNTKKFDEQCPKKETTTIETN